MKPLALESVQYRRQFPRGARTPSPHFAEDIGKVERENRVSPTLGQCVQSGSQTIQLEVNLDLDVFSHPGAGITVGIELCQQPPAAYVNGMRFKGSAVAPDPDPKRRIRAERDSPCRPRFGGEDAVGDLDPDLPGMLRTWADLHKSADEKVAPQAV